MALPALKPSLLEPGELAGLTVEQYHQMLETGILEDGDPIELLDGLLVQKDRGGAGMTISPRHRLTVMALMRLDRFLADRGCHVMLQSPLTILPKNEPEPDGMIVQGEPARYRDRHPGPEEVSCLIEVADSSLRRDRGWKQRIYASAGIPQYLILNLLENQVECHESPEGESYRVRQVLGPGEQVELLLPEGGGRLSVPVSTLLA
ncbi:MAG TPA: Uma2 family endonuclease [Thermoanaerobaculia bacterium]|nr:Uma2 family endonuclease [Thermoanaerobaculia bacterium]